MQAVPSGGQGKIVVDLIRKAISRNEIAELLEGKDGYSLESDSWAPVCAPIDWTAVIPLIYREYAETQDASIKKKYENAVARMLSGSAEDVYCGVAVLYFQMLREKSGRTPFSLDMDRLLRLAKEGISGNTDGLRDAGLWNEISRYRRLFSSKFSVEI